MVRQRVPVLVDVDLDHPRPRHHPLTIADLEPALTLDAPASLAEKRKARKDAHESKQLARLVEKEGLADYYAKAYRIAAISHARIGEWEPAAVFANKGYMLKHMEDPGSAWTAELYQLTASFVQSWESELKNGSAKKVEK